MPRAQFVCPCSLFSADRLAAIVCLFVARDISKGSSRRQQSLTTQKTLRPSCGLDKMPRLASPPQVGRRLFDFSEFVLSFGIPRARLQTYCNRLAIAPREAFKPREASICVRLFRQPRGVPQRAHRWYSCSCSHKRGRLNGRRRR